MRLLSLLLVLVFAAPAWAVKLKLKSEEKEFEAAVVSLQEGEVAYRKGRKDLTAKFEDFELTSQFAIKNELCANTGNELLDLARFALHRGLFAEAQDAAARAAKLDGFADQARRISDVVFTLEADAVLEKAIVALDRKDVPAARPLLEDVVSRFPNTPAAVKADILLGTLKRVELEVRAAALEKEAHKAQEDADAEEQKKRQPIDDWLDELSVQVTSNEELKKEADKDCDEGASNRGLPKYENVVEAMITLRNSIAKNRNLLKYRGQGDHANRIDDKAKALILETYYRWAFVLYTAQRYDVAVSVCKRGIAMDPKDRRFLSLKVDIDEVYDPTDE